MMHSSVCLLALLLMFSTGLAATPYLTSLFSYYEASSLSLILTNSIITSQIQTSSTTLTYIQNYTFDPVIGYGITSMNFMYQPAGTSTGRLYYDVSIASIYRSNCTFTFRRSTGNFTALTLKYMITNSLYFDVQNNNASYASNIGSRLTSNRTAIMSITFKTKSNQSNSQIMYFTVGMDQSWTGTAFRYTLSNISYGVGNTSYNLQISVTPPTGSANALTYIRICTISYQIMTLVANQQFLNILVNTNNLNGIVPGTSSGATDFSVIFSGMVDYTFNQSVSFISFSIALAGATFSVQGLGARSSFIWFRNLVCPGGYYINAAASSCLACHFSCLTCNNSQLINQCLTCNESNFRTFSNGSCLCMTSYIQVNLASCSEVTCPSTCLTCLNIDICGSCNSSLQRYLNNKRCECMQRFYDNGNNLMCESCNITCLTCFRTSNNCTSCSDSDFRVLNGSNTCICMTKYYENGTSKCNPCHYSCASCTSETDCSSCTGIYNRYQTISGTGLCLCTQGYYDDGANQTCVSCPYSCANCTSSTLCQLCASQTTRVLQSDACGCIVGYYDDGSSPACQACQYSCKECISSYSCTNCDPDKFRIQNSTVSDFCICQDYYFEATIGNVQCSSCHATCLTCSSAESTGCLSCNSDKFRELEENGTCVCKVKYFQTSPTTEMCSQCNYTCLTCVQTSSNCGSCDPTLFRKNTSLPTCPCMDGYYDNLNPLCQKCNRVCLTCQNASECKTCHSTRDSNDLVNCPCLSGFYDDGVSAICAPCRNTCLTCNNSEKCNQCPSIRFLDSHNNCICNMKTYETLSAVCTDCEYSCSDCEAISTNCTICNVSAGRYLKVTADAGACLCENGYYDDGSHQQCQKCQYTCQTCNKTSCITCNINKYRAANGSICSCIDGYFDDLNQQLCLACHYSCKTCISSDQCDSCSDDKFRELNASKLCSCMSGYHDNGIDELCSTCIYSCQTCNESTICTSCNSQRFRISDGSTNCICKDGYFDTGVAQCTKCHYSCATCNDSMSCISCPSGRTHTANQLCNCGIGFYDISNEPLCGACHISCLTCINQTNCQSCDPSNFRAFNGFKCPCIVNYFDNNVAMCSACHYSCKQCTNLTKCDSCDETHFRIMNDASGFCDCLAGYYNRGTQELCQTCLYTCQTCLDSTTCESCSLASNRIYYNQTKQCTCKDGYYDSNGLSQVCSQCDHTCLTCTNGSACANCDSDMHRTQNSSSCVCNDGYFDNGVALCEICNHTCATCVNGSTCTSCGPLRLANTTTDLCDCNPGYFEDPLNKSCLKCDQSCETCSNASACITCNMTQNRQATPLADSLCKCLIGYFEDGTNAVCQACPYSCSECSSASICTGCLEANFRQINGSQCICKTGYFDTQTNNPQCQECAPTCQTCVNSSKLCTNCSASQFRQLLNTKCQCKTGYFDDGVNETCQECHYSCMSCNIKTRCQTCDTSNFRLMNLNGLCDCLSGYYDDNISELCIRCDHTCSTCTDDAKCTGCQSGTHRTFDNNTSTCICDQYYFDDGSSQACQACKYYCSTCSSADTCDTCDPDKFREKNNSICVCKPTYYDAGKQLCLLCNYTCLYCDNSYSCKTCNASHHRDILNISTLCSCLPGYYDNGTAQCQQCILGCLTCTNSTGCISCNGTDFRVVDLETRQCICKAGYYSDGSNSTCQKCPHTCARCTGPDECSDCNATYFRVFDITNTLCVCQKGYYDDMTHTLCIKCHYSCMTCTNSSECNDCNIDRFRSLGTSKLCECISRYYDDGANQLCLACNYKCLNCSINATNCIACDTDNTFRAVSPNCNCQNGYFPVVNVAVCSQCQYTCRTCSSLLACDSCNNSLYREMLLGGTFCTCMVGYFDDGTNNQTCQSCDYTCYICQNTSTNCTSCGTAYHRTKSGNTCLCDTKYYDDGSNLTCKSCHFSCQTCESPVCLTCDIDKHRIKNQTDQLCMCQEGFFSFGTSQTCLLCNPSCKSCDSGLSCLTCNQDNFRVLNPDPNKLGIVNPYCPCFEKYYPINQTHCALCNYTCQLCNDFSSCSYCNTTAFRVLKSNKCVCQDGYYDRSIEQCEQCDVSCKTCTTIAVCQSCNSNYYLLDSICHENCPQTYYGVNSTCLSCGSNCKKCLDSTFCTQCSSTYYVQQGVCVQTCSEGFFAEVSPINTCQLCNINCSTCTSLSTCTKCKSPYYLSSGFCYPCSSSCLSCSGPGHVQCLSCVYPLFLNSTICVNITCQSYQYVDSLAGCKDCSSLFSNSQTCNTTDVLTCANGYKKTSQTVCTMCSAITGYYIDSSHQCSEICGDGLLFELACDDGNKEDGDGCSSRCSIEEEWTCTHASPSICTLTGGLMANVYKQDKIAGKNQLYLYVSLSIALKLANKNFQFSYNNISGNPIQTKSITLKDYRILVEYSKALQNSQATLQIALYKTSRRLLQTYVNYINFSFPIDISTFPPAEFYEANTLEALTNGQFYLQAFSLITLILAVISSIFMLRRTVFYSIQAVSYIFVVFMTQGFALNKTVDWLEYVIYGLRSAALVGGFTIEQCSACLNSGDRYGFSSLFTQNAGAIFTIDATFLTILAITSFISAQFKKYMQGSPRLTSFHRFLQYSLIAFGLGFNYNLMFSALLYFRDLTLPGTIQIINLIFAVAAVFGNSLFFIYLFRWSKQLNEEYIHPLQTNSKVTLQNGESRKPSIAESLQSMQSATKGGNQYRPAESDSPTKKSQAKEIKEVQQSQNYDRNLDIMLSYDLSNLLDQHYSQASYFNFTTYLRTYLLVIFSVAIEHNIARCCLLLITHTIYLVYMFTFSPFSLKLNNIRHWMMEVALQVLLILDVAAVCISVYSFGLDVFMVVLTSIFVFLNLAFLIVQLLYANRQWVWEKVKACLMGIRRYKKQAIEKDKTDRNQVIEYDLKKDVNLDNIEIETVKDKDDDVIQKKKTSCDEISLGSGEDLSNYGKDFFERVVESKKISRNLLSQYTRGRKFRVNQ